MPRSPGPISPHHALALRWICRGDFYAARAAALDDRNDQAAAADRATLTRLAWTYHQAGARLRAVGERRARLWLLPYLERSASRPIVGGVYGALHTELATLVGAPPLAELLARAADQASSPSASGTVCAAVPGPNAPGDRGAAPRQEAP